MPTSRRETVIPEDATLYACVCIGDGVLDADGKLDPVPEFGGGFESSLFSSEENKSKVAQEMNQSKRGNAKIPWNDPRWIRCEPEYRSFLIANSWKSDFKGERKISVCPREDCAATFELEVVNEVEINGARTISRSDVLTSKRATPRKRFSKDSSARSDAGKAEHTVINPLFAASFGGSMRFNDAGINPDLSDSDSGSQDSSFRPIPESTSILLDHVCFHLSLKLKSPSPFPQFVDIYGQLAKTPQGADIMQRSGHLEMFIEQLKSNGVKQDTYGADVCAEETVQVSRAKHETDVWSSVPSRRSVLLVLGSIGASSYGLNVLRRVDSEILSIISEIALKDGCLPIRGTAVRMLGLISKTYAGSVVLKRLGWEGGPQGNECSGIVVPKDVESFFSFTSNDQVSMRLIESVSWQLIRYMV